MIDKKQIAIVKVGNDDIARGVHEALDLIGAKGLMREGMTVLLKPNLLSAKPPERAVTTHPEVVRAVIKWVKQFKPKRVVVADSSSGINPGNTEKALKASKLQDVADQEGVEAMPFERDERLMIQVPEPLALAEFPSAKLLRDADLIINLPKIKTHGLTRLTCCIKNMFGIMLLGQKSKTHAAYPTLDSFSKALADIYMAGNPQLTIVDGILCQEGKGPSAGDVVKLDTILAGFDGVALDATVCAIIGLDVHRIPHVGYAAKKGAGTTDLSTIEFKGTPIEQVKRPFKIPGGSQIVGAPIPQFLAKGFATQAFKAIVRFDPDKCKVCGTCWKNCPVGAITPPPDIKQGTLPAWNADRCITCYCCAETCPFEAIEFSVNMVKNLLLSKYGAMLVAGIIVLGLIAWWLVTVLF